jgi:AcrR family transcriptional regulator
MTSVPPGKESRREQKRQETLKRISEKGLKLFIANGYEGTTLEAIAAAAGITKRTFFYYFKSKDEVLLVSQGGGFIEALRPAILDESPDQAPFVAVHKCLSKLVSRYETRESIVIDRLLQSTEALRARKQAIFVEMEEALFAALCELWPQPARRAALRLVAMVSIGAMRVAMESWRQDGGKRPLAQYLQKAFAGIEAEI